MLTIQAVIILLIFYPHLFIHSKLDSCIFPSVYRRKAMYECLYSPTSPPHDLYFQDKSDGPPWWCPLTDNFDHYPDGQFCPETPTTYAGNHPGHTCYFPFVHKSRWHNTCIRSEGVLHRFHPDDSLPTDKGLGGYWWCSTTENFDIDGYWTRCRPQHTQLLPCFFSKRTKLVGGIVGDIETECQPFAGNWLCLTELGQLRECPSYPAVTQQPVVGGNDPGRPCHFPFSATLPLITGNGEWIGSSHRRNFSTCVPTNRMKSINGVYPNWITYWCATTDDFDRDKLWTRCTMNDEDYLGQIWTDLSWSSLLSDHESDRLTNASSSLQGLKLWEHSSNRVEYQKALGGLDMKGENIEWWNWLAPFWWTEFNNNLSLQSNDENRAFPNSELTTNPLSIAFKIPHWLQEWKSPGWISNSKTLNARWNHLKKTIQHRWNYRWWTGFMVGISTCSGILLVSLVYFIIFCLNSRQRRRIFSRICKNTFTRNLKSKKLLPIGAPSTQFHDRSSRNDALIYESSDLVSKQICSSSPTYGPITLLANNLQYEANLLRLSNFQDSTGNFQSSLLEQSPLICGCYIPGTNCTQEIMVRLLNLVEADEQGLIHCTKLHQLLTSVLHNHNHSRTTCQFTSSAWESTRSNCGQCLLDETNSICYSRQSDIEDLHITPSAPPPSYDQLTE